MSAYELARIVDRVETERDAAVEEAGKLRDALREAYTALERAQFDAHDREWARDLLTRLRAALSAAD